MNLMRCIPFFLICVHLSKMASSRINYCGAAMCAETDTHTFCQYSDRPGILCTGFMPAHLTKEEKLNIMARFNQRRNDAALGLLGNLPAAGDMLALRWVEELAREAQLWANQCIPPKIPEEHDACRDLYSVPVGQNVASVVGEAPGLRVESLIDLWYMQGRHYKGNISSYFPSAHDRSYYGDFAQMLWSRTLMVGCGRSRFMAMWQDRLRTVERLVCNLAPRGPRTDLPLWRPARPASMCPPRTRPASQFPGLCAVNESPKLDKKNNKMSIEDNVILSALLELDRNSSHNVENLDEIYVAKLAAITMEQSDRPQRSNSVSVGEIVRKLGIHLEGDNNTLNKRIANERRKIRRFISKPFKSRRKLRTVGRPKSYYLYELSNDEDEKRKNHAMDIKPVVDNEHKDAYTITYDEKEQVENLTNSTNSTEDINAKNSEISQIPEAMVLNSSSNISIENNNLNNNISNDDNNSSSSEISDSVIIEYLSNPETARELQETLLRMEQTMAGSSPESNSTSMVQYITLTPAKVRRELRTTQSEEFQRFKKIFDETTNEPREDPDETPDRNAVVLGNKQTVLQSFLGYLPNMKSLGFIPSANYGAACSIKPSVFMTLLNCFYIILYIV